MGFIHLRSHSYYSFLRGLPSPQELANTAVDLGMAALALTDHHSLSGAIEFQDACQQAGIKPILGLEVETALPEKMGMVEPGTPNPAGDGYGGMAQPVPDQQLTNRR